MKNTENLDKNFLFIVDLLNFLYGWSINLYTQFVSYLKQICFLPLSSPSKVFLNCQFFPIIKLFYKVGSFGIKLLAHSMILGTEFWLWFICTPSYNLTMVSVVYSVYPRLWFYPAAFSHSCFLCRLEDEWGTCTTSCTHTFYIQDNHEIGCSIVHFISF